MSEVHCEKCGQASWLPKVFEKVSTELQVVKKENEELKRQLVRLCEVKDATVKDCKHNYEMFLSERRNLHVLAAVNNQLIENLKFYANGWVQKKARINSFGIMEEVWKNPAVQDDHGRRATETLEKLKGK